MQKNTILCLSILLCLVTSPASAKTKVVATFKPIHSLVASIMQGTGNPDLLVSGNASPHTHQLQPSQAKMLYEADIIFWLGASTETFLEKILHSLPEDIVVIQLDQSPNLALLDTRLGGLWETHDNKKIYGHHAHAHHYDKTDPHIWLDPTNAKQLAIHIAKELSKVDPDHADIYAMNASNIKEELSELQETLSASLYNLRGKSFIVFHDAYQYFENRFALNAIGSIKLHPDEQVSAKHILKIREQIKKSNVVCIFAEPQFPSKLVQTITENTEIRTGYLDAIGADISPGPNLYVKLLEQLAINLNNCLN